MFVIIIMSSFCNFHYINILNKLVLLMIVLVSSTSADLNLGMFFTGETQELRLSKSSPHGDCLSFQTLPPITGLEFSYCYNEKYTPFRLGNDKKVRTTLYSPSESVDYCLYETAITNDNQYLSAGIANCNKLDNKWFTEYQIVQTANNNNCLCNPGRRTVGGYTSCINWEHEHHLVISYDLYPDELCDSSAMANGRLTNVPTTNNENFIFEVNNKCLGFSKPPTKNLIDQNKHQAPTFTMSTNCSTKVNVQRLIHNVTEGVFKTTFNYATKNSIDFDHCLYQSIGFNTGLTFASFKPCINIIPSIEAIDLELVQPELDRGVTVNKVGLCICNKVNDNTRNVDFGCFVSSKKDNFWISKSEFGDASINTPAQLCLKLDQYNKNSIFSDFEMFLTKSINEQIESDINFRTRENPESCIEGHGYTPNIIIDQCTNPLALNLKKQYKNDKEYNEKNNHYPSATRYDTLNGVDYCLVYTRGTGKDNPLDVVVCGSVDETTHYEYWLDVRAKKSSGTQKEDNPYRCLCIWNENVQAHENYNGRVPYWDRTWKGCLASHMDGFFDSIENQKKEASHIEKTIQLMCQQRESVGIQFKYEPDKW